MSKNKERVAANRSDSEKTCDSRGVAEIQRWIQCNIAEALKVEPESLDSTQPFTSYGLDSIAAFTMTLELAEWLERDLPASLFWEYQTVSELAQHLAKEVTKQDS